MGKFWQDLRCGTLMLAKTPGFTLANLLKPLLSADPNRRIELEDHQLHAAVSRVAWINILNGRELSQSFDGGRRSCGVL
ncbi:MAG: hypothetical protein ACRD4K_11000 [Candidatus Acidiferrales bacterium]